MAEVVQVGVPKVVEAPACSSSDSGGRSDVDALFLKLNKLMKSEYGEKEDLMTDYTGVMKEMNEKGDYRKPPAAAKNIKKAEMECTSALPTAFLLAKTKMTHGT